MFNLIESFCCVTFDLDENPNKNRSRNDSLEDKKNSVIDTKRS